MKAMIDGYHNNGWEVHLLAMNTTRHFVKHETLETLYTYINGFEWIDIDNRIRPLALIRNYLFSKLPEHAERFHQTVFEHKLLETIKAVQPDVIQIESVYLTSYLEQVKKASNALLILRSHNVEYHIWHGLAVQSRNILKRRYLLELTKRLKEYERRAWKKYDMVLAITEKDAFHITRHEKIKHLLVVPFGLDTDNILPDANSDLKKGYHIGAMDWIPNQNGIKWFIKEAWPGIRKLVPDFEFHFAGRKMPAQFMEQQPAGIYCQGEVKNAQDFISDKKILIVPITTAGGIRIKIMEGMVRGKIVISTPEGVKGLEAKPETHYLAARKPEDFARAIQWCVNNPAEAARIAENGRRLMLEKYDQNKIIRNLMEQVDTLEKELR